MLWVPRHAGQLSYSHTELIHVIRRCGLTSGLKLCLDAGDANSYSSGQSWLDTSGNGYDFFRGVDGSAAADDPTFNGTAGQRSSGEYWSFDGGDFFRYDSANEAWMQNLHKDNAKFTFVAGMQFGASGGNDGILGTGYLGNGVHWYKSSGEQIHLEILKPGPIEVFFKPTTLTIAQDVPLFTAWSLDEAVGANGAFGYTNGTAQFFTSTYTAPTADPSQYVMEIGAYGGANVPLSATSRVWFVAAWEGVALTQTQVDALFMGLRGRMGI